LRVEPVSPPKRAHVLVHGIFFSRNSPQRCSAAFSAIKINFTNMNLLTTFSVKTIGPTCSFYLMSVSIDIEEYEINIRAFGAGPTIYLEMFI